MTKAKSTDNLLSADWFNEVMNEVLGEIEEILEDVLFDGLLSTGYSPGEMVTGKGDVRRLTPEQFTQVREMLEPADQIRFDQMLQEVNAKANE